ncbi:hypothetical protein BT63DRAFT_409530 [Microthyrium microscopicum]|uniref:Uncharacterized protein n=1 Tax=Microthyrium microscopicum TaxID=703497 RepID=A0A6A6UVK9_9PEZI|nr:hypothetical protein BT63DRAFT_409530 [Microthyrium microscopicum]
MVNTGPTRPPVRNETISGPDTGFRNAWNQDQYQPFSSDGKLPRFILIERMLTKAGDASDFEGDEGLEASQFVVDPMAYGVYGENNFYLRGTSDELDQYQSYGPVRSQEEPQYEVPRNIERPESPDSNRAEPPTPETGSIQNSMILPTQAERDHALLGMDNHSALFADANEMPATIDEEDFEHVCGQCGYREIEATIRGVIRDVGYGGVKRCRGAILFKRQNIATDV